MKKDQKILFILITILHMEKYSLLLHDVLTLHKISDHEHTFSTCDVQTRGLNVRFERDHAGMPMPCAARR